MEKLEVMLPVTGQWVTLVEWDADDCDFDAMGWLDKWGERIGTGVAMLPLGGYVDLTHFAAVRRG